MDSLPIVTRELRLAARRPRTFLIRVGFALCGCVYVMGLLSPSFRGVASPAVAGRSLFQILGGAAFFLCLIAGAFVTADSLSEEKREGTMGLLFLTDMGGCDIALGKLVAKSLNPFYALAGILPLLGLPILFGGVTSGEFVRLSLTLLNTLFLSVTIGLGISSISLRGRRACLGTLGALGALSGLPWFLDFWAGAAGWSRMLMALSPAQGWYLIDETRYQAASGAFWGAFWTAHFLAWTCAAAACLATPRTWKDFAPNPKQALRLRRWREWTLGSKANQRAGRARWLDLNPVLWVARRERHRRAFFWGFLGLYFAVWLLCYRLMPNAWATPQAILVTATLLHLTLKLWLAIEASRRLASDKRSGVLELLLVTPLEVSEILKGLIAGMRRQFLLPIIFVAGIDILLLLFGMSQSAGSDPLPLVFIVGMGLFLADAYTLSWVGLWEGLSAKGDGQAFARTILQVLVFPSLLFVGVGGVLFMSAPGSPGPLVACWFAVGYLTDLVLCVMANAKLSERFRAAATGVFESRPRFSLPKFRPRQRGGIEPLSADFSLFSDP
jgi:ABC-type Na+ efflux pump permease subunit